MCLLNGFVLHKDTKHKGTLWVLCIRGFVSRHPKMILFCDNTSRKTIQSGIRPQIILDIWKRHRSKMNLKLSWDPWDQLKGTAKCTAVKGESYLGSKIFLAIIVIPSQVLINKLLQRLSYLLLILHVSLTTMMPQGTGCHV